MTEDTPAAHTPAAHTPAADEPTEPDQIRADIAQTRAELGDTVDQLSAKLDVKAQASQKASELKARAQHTADQVVQAASPPVRHALDRAGATLGPTARQVSDKARPHRGKILAAAALGLLVVVVARRRSGGQS